MGKVSTRRQVGERGEDLAAAELERQGMAMLARNWQCGSARSTSSPRSTIGGRRTVVFCEVKCRTGLGFGDPLEAITYAKLRKLRQLAGGVAAAATPDRDAGSGSTRSGVVMLPGQAPRLTHVRGIG